MEWYLSNGESIEVFDGWDVQSANKVVDRTIDQPLNTVYGTQQMMIDYKKPPFSLTGFDAIFHAGMYDLNSYISFFTSSHLAPSSIHHYVM